MTLDWLAQLLGLPAGLHGHIEDTASTGTHDRPRRRPAGEARRAGRRLLRARALVGRRRRAACSSSRRGRCRPTPTSGCRPDALDLDNACAVVATIGTTSTSSVDPVAEIADACEREGVWLHVDAAYAGSAAVCPELRHHFAGWERADSIVVNPHKWLFTPMDCSTLWTRRPGRLPRRVQPRARVPARRARRWRACPSSAPRSAAASARSSSGRCCAATAERGLQERIREAIRLAELFEGWVREEPGWEVAAPRPFSLVCFRRDGVR